MSEERSKGISLRKKRTVKPPKAGKEISAPRQISAPMPVGLAAATQSSSGRPSNESSRSARPRPDAPRERPQRADKTADLVKRRYSQRITQLPSDFGAGAPPMPSMPQVPNKYRDAPPSRDGRPPGSSDGRAFKVDMKAIRDPNLRPAEYVATLLQDASEEDIRRYQEELRKVKNRTSTDLQHNVYQNRTQFIKISKEAEKLKGEMRTLRQLMSELTGTLGQTTSAVGTNGDSLTLTARKAANRSSVANLEALWNSHLQELWKRVEGSQKYLPAIPGRHIVWESGRWVELNAATWRARHRIHLILLNDHLLVASEKKQRADGVSQSTRDKRTQGKELQARRCWPLQDVQMADLSSRAKIGGAESGAANAINVRVGSESYTFAVFQGDPSEKSTMLSTFRKALEDLRKSTEAETEERGKAQDSVNYFATRDLDILKKTELMESLSENVANQRASMFVDVDGKQQSIRWVESQLDDLDIDIALQKFEDAVKKVERLRSLAKNIRSNAMAQNIVAFKVNERAGKLANVLIKQMVENNSWITSVKLHVTWIVRLGYEERAREAYLSARTDVIRKRSRQCIFEGNLPDYIFQISFIYFTIMKNTVDTYQKCFPQVMMSACVKWAKEHVDAFNTILARQLSSVDQGSQVWRDCMDQAFAHAAMLTQVGLDFKELVGKGVDEEGGEVKPVGLGLSS
ncbi:Cullin repeat-like-containing domain protein [Clohesyomyces aquaticus]|uniref:Exocyst complex component EXO84 n=1 Tax=Clohesyomyces aquaticus TaxID=1231657 RepID=A0A1Y2A9M5_9PLEO|nr:Cullin repeat-like-containing domain protein [Clohesyomyces aquaticus]